jgi:succinate-semialdehyde dehydrogenase/glutarate-semialdehyde dehydrogenase
VAGPVGEATAQVLRRWFDLIVENGEDLARLITLEEGKPLAESRGEVAYAASFVEWFAEEAKRIRGDVFDAPEPSRRIVVLKEPVGVCVAITPWNFPAAMITRKAAPALAAGCTMLVKPAEQTPLSALALAELAQRAGVPAGVLNVVTGDPREIGPVLTGHPLVRKVSFTGSTEVGRLLLEQAARSVKRTSMELGGSAPVLVFDDADLDGAVDAVIATKYRNTGQACISATASSCRPASTIDSPSSSPPASPSSSSVTGSTSAPSRARSSTPTPSPRSSPTYPGRSGRALACSSAVGGTSAAGCSSNRPCWSGSPLPCW